MAGKIIGILALQGAFIEHEQAFKKCGAEAVQVRTVEQLDTVDGLVIPGGESTTIGKLMKKYGLDQQIKKRTDKGMPLWGTCAGMILMAKELDKDAPWLNLMDMKVKRNAYGRQVDSFETSLEVEGIGNIKGVFIRAPYVEKVWGNARIISMYDDKIVAVQQGANLLATSFHPELTAELDMHKYFLSML